MRRCSVLHSGVLGLAIRLGLFGLPGALAAGACTGAIGGKPMSSSSSGGMAPDAGVPFEPLSPVASVTKVKRILTGLPPTDADVQAAATPAGLRTLIQSWIQTPQYGQKMQEFFMTSFQQTQLATDGSDFVLQSKATPFAYPALYWGQMQQNFEESFARTMVQLIAEGHPFTEALTTRQFMLTPALAMFYAYADDVMFQDQQSASANPQSQITTANPDFQFKVTSVGPPIPNPNTSDPTKADYMLFFNPDLPKETAFYPTDLTLQTLAADSASCQIDPCVYDKNSAFNGAATSLFSVIFSYLPVLENKTLDPFGAFQCGAGQDTSHPQVVTTDFSTWTMTTIRQPGPAEATSLFYDLDTLRSTDELVLRTPRVGFFTTPSFFAQWPTNNSNKDRVIVNQTLIGALGEVVTPSGYDATLPNGLDPVHAAKGTACYGCHATMDPMAQFFHQAYTLSYTNQDTSLGDPTQVATPGVFALGSEQTDTTNGAPNTIYDLGAKLAALTDSSGVNTFAAAWAQKLCYAANSSACAVDDPEFLRVVGVFQKSGFSWPALVEELFSSPLVTDAAATTTSSTMGVTTAVDRESEFCDLLSFRLGIDNICALGAVEAQVYPPPSIITLATALPADGYSRGVAAPFRSNSPTLFFRAGVEQLCVNVASSVIDARAPSKYVSTRPDAAITDFVRTVMGVPRSDPRYSGLLAILNDHFNGVMNPSDAGDADGGATTPASASDALKSTFVLACTSPLTVAVGL